MSQWVDRITNHPLFAALDEAEQLLVEGPEPPAEDLAGVHAKARLITVVRRVKVALKAADPLVTPPQALENVRGNLQHLVNEVRAYNGSKSTGHLVNANQQADNMLQNFAAVMPPQTPAAVAELGRAVRQYHAGIGEHLTRLSSKAQAIAAGMRENEHTAKDALEQLTKAVESLTTDINTQKGRLDAAIATFQEQFSKAQEEQRAEFAKGERLRTEQAADAEAKRREQFEAAVQTREQAFTTLMNEMRGQRAVVEEQLQTRASELLTAMEGDRKRAEELVHVIGNTGMTGEYQKVADAARAQARFWNGLAVVSMITLVGVALWLFVPALQGGHAWESIAGRVFISLTIGVLAGYAVRQAARYHDIERSNRRVQLELASIDPYLAALPQQEREAVKKELAQRFFGQVHQAPALAADGALPTGTLMDAFRLFLDHLAKR